MENNFRFATKGDESKILYFIKELAKYEKMYDEVTATEELLSKWIFEERKANVIFIMDNGKEVGFALFFNNFSTFLGKPGIYLEDLYIEPKYRHRGYGKALIKKLAKIAIENGYGRIEWWCLDSNKPSMEFYLSLGAEQMKDWTTYRVDGDAFKKLLEI